MFRACSLGVLASAFFLLSNLLAEEPTKPQPPVGVWTVSEGLSAPESAYYDPQSQQIFVANVAGSPGDKDGQGWISKLDKTGKMLAAQWVKGFNAPKGLRSHGSMLWASDIDELVGIDIASGEIKHRIKVEGAKFLNDVAIDNDGTLYVSDMLASRIYKIGKDGKPAVFVEGEEFEMPNGLLAHDEELIVAAWGTEIDPMTFACKKPGRLYSINLGDKSKSLITKNSLGMLDGLETDGSGGYYVSDWIAGKVYRVTSDGDVTLLMEGFKGSADLGLIDGQLLLVPRMMEDKLTAYKIEE